MQIDKNGAKTDCFGYEKSKHGNGASCKVLMGWYKPDACNRCSGCPFYKSKERYEREAQGDYEKEN